MGEIIRHGDYVFTTQTSLPRDAILASCNEMSRIIEANFLEDAAESAARGFNSGVPKTTPVFFRYNLLLYPLPGFHALYYGIRDLFRFLSQDTSPYYVQCWLNVAEYGEFIDWHDHYPPEANSWHGFYCVDAEPSRTTYRLPNGREIDIPSKDNQFVLSRSAGDKHRTWPWEDRSRPRTTIAFDIVPAFNCNATPWLNHWVPV